MMTVEELARQLSIEIISGEKNINTEVKGVYIGDLLSWVMAHMEAQDVWITIQTNINIVAVAALGEAACIIVAEGAEIEEPTKIKAEEENIPVLRSHLSAYELAVKINELLCSR